MELWEQYVSPRGDIRISGVVHIRPEKLQLAVADQPDFTPDEYYSTRSSHGFAKLKLSADLGQDAYQTALLTYVKTPAVTDQPKPPAVPMANALTLRYQASTTLELNSSSIASYKERAGRFFHVAPFGESEQHPYLNAAEPVYLFPQFDFINDKVQSEAEFYIGISALNPPQNLALLFQVVDGTANPLVSKPLKHINWTFLRKNEWTAFAENDVQDDTGELLNSGVITLPFPVKHRVTTPCSRRICSGFAPQYRKKATPFAGCSA